MRRSSFVSYFVSGILLMNSLPHTIIALTGRRNLTPFGQDSSAALNGLWAMISAIGGYVLLRQADRRSGASEGDTAWQLPFEAGCLCWSSFGVLYSYATGKQTQTRANHDHPHRRQ